MNYKIGNNIYTSEEFEQIIDTQRVIQLLKQAEDTAYQNLIKTLNISDCDFLFDVIYNDVASSISTINESEQ